METLCFLCGKKIGPFREQYSIKDFKNEIVSPPPNFTEGDRTCADCFNHRKDVERANPSSNYPSRPTRLLYFAPIFMGILGGVLMYIAVKDQDQGMANNGMALGTILTFIEIIIIIVSWGSLMSTLGNMGI